jgi:type II secretory pathway pseudopilin PulG
MRSRFRGVVVALLGVAALVSSPGAARGQETPEQMKKAYETAQEQLKAAQERKNQLAAENEALKANIADLQKQLASANARMEDMKRVDAEHAEKSFFLRSHYMAWQSFVKTYPEVLGRWKSFLGNEFITAPTTAPSSDVVDREWPMSVRM